MLQLHAAYVIPELLELMSDQDAKYARALLASLSHFDFTANQSFDSDIPCDSPTAALLAVSQNILTRGLPTRAPLSLSRTLLDLSWPGSSIEFTDEIRGIGFQLSDAATELPPLLLQALHVVDGRIDLSCIHRPASGDGLGFDLDSEAERNFWSGTVVSHFGSGLAQALLPQVPLDRLLRFASDENGKLVKLRKNATSRDFYAQRVDFVLPLPYGIEDTAPKGIVIEIDGPHHQVDLQKRHDEARDIAARLAGWEVDRIPLAETGNWQRHLPSLIHSKSHAYCIAIEKNYAAPLFLTTQGRQAEELMLAPVVAAWVHRALLEVVRTELLPLEQLTWRVAIVEHDVPGGALGMQAFAEQIKQLFILEGKQRQFPTLEVTIYTTAEYAASRLHVDENVQPIEAYHPGIACDLLLDIAVLAREGWRQAVPVPMSGVRVILRASGLQAVARKIATAPLVRYAEVSAVDEDDEYLHHPIAGRTEALLHFLRDIFRKADFRTGQLPILNRSIRGMSVLGLLPTGGGKSLTYQLAALLQPGVCLVVDPIKSLMQDQCDGLHDNLIDAVSFVNSSVLATATRRIDQLIHGEVLFFFISPERLQIERFREQLRQMGQQSPQPIGFSFCVVDEAHCVSEWGHDFRTQYLRLGETARRVCHTYDGREVPLYGLTATASFDVLADVQRELMLLDQESVVRIRTTRRRELNFRVLEAKKQTKVETVRGLLKAIPNELALLSDRAGRVLSVPDTDQDDDDNDGAAPPNPLPPSYRSDAFFKADGNGLFPHAGLVFCPYKSSKVVEGVLSVLAELRELPEIVGDNFTSSGGGFGDADGGGAAREMMQAQTNFVRNRLNLLVATKAFGMGIDKPNVRYTVHMAYPSSIESLVQEAGRAGRDRSVALNYILYDPADSKINENFFFKSFKGRDKEARMVFELLTRVSMPATGPLDRLLGVLLAEFEDITITPLAAGLWPKDQPTRLYLNKEFKVSYGYIDLRSPQRLIAYPTTDGAAASHDVSRALCERVIEFIHEEAPAIGDMSTAGLVTWLASRTAFSTQPGILDVMASARDGEARPAMLISFFNGEAAAMAHAIGGNLSDQMIWKACAYAANGDDFVKALEREFRAQTGQAAKFDLAAIHTLKKGFSHLRDEQDTFKALHRLSLLKIVDDYTIDYGAQVITLYLNRLPDNEDVYVERFAEYLNRYTTTARAKMLAEEARQSPRGDSVLLKVLGKLLDFTYQEIAAKRKAATREMAQACIKGIEEPDEDLGQFFDLYFNSKYAHAGFLPDDTERGTQFSRDIIWTYLGYMTEPPDQMGLTRDNVKHLRGGCARMLSSGANQNGAILLLDGFAIVFLEAERQGRSNKLLKLATDKMLLGFECFREMENLSHQDLLHFCDVYADKVAEIEEKVGEHVRNKVRPLLLLNQHLRWLTAFNERFDDRSILL